MMRNCLPLAFVLCLFSSVLPGAGEGKPDRRDPKLVASPPLVPVDVAELSKGVERVDIYLLMGQSNMRGRGFLPDKVATDPRIVMLHMIEDEWFVARHPLHHQGDPKTHENCSREGVGPGLAFAEAMIKDDPKVRIALIPCAAGGTSVGRWQKPVLDERAQRKKARAIANGTYRESLYERAVRKAQLALEATKSVNGRVKGVLWTQGEADRKYHDAYMPKLTKMIDDLRADLKDPDLPFIACTVMGKSDAINKVILSLPEHRPNTDAVDAQDIEYTPENSHYSAKMQAEIGKRFAAKMKVLIAAP